MKVLFKDSDNDTQLYFQSLKRNRIFVLHQDGKDREKDISDISLLRPLVSTKG